LRQMPVKGISEPINVYEGYLWRERRRTED
jgi:hypothetical protein